MGNLRTIILIWGAAILIYLVVTNSSGSSTVLDSFGRFSRGLTYTLQGRGA